MGPQMVTGNVTHQLEYVTPDSTRVRCKVLLYEVTDVLGFTLLQKRALFC